MLDQARSELIQDVVRRSWFHGHPRHHAISTVAAAMAGRVLAFRRGLLHLESRDKRWPQSCCLTRSTSGLARHDQPLVRFARTFGDLFADLDGWHLPAPAPRASTSRQPMTTWTYGSAGGPQKDNNKAQAP